MDGESKSDGCKGTDDAETAGMTVADPVLRGTSADRHGDGKRTDHADGHGEDGVEQPDGLLFGLRVALRVEGCRNRQRSEPSDKQDDDVRDSTDNGDGTENQQGVDKDFAERDETGGLGFHERTSFIFDVRGSRDCFCRHSILCHQDG